MHTSDRRKDLLCALTLCLLAIANWTGRLAGPIDIRWDAGVYYTLGTSLYEGKGYRLLNEPGEIRAVQYPPLLPAIVALHQAIAGSADPFVAGHAMRWSWAVLYAMYIPGVFWLSKRYFSRGLAMAVAVTILLNPQMTFLSDAAFAELPFAVGSVVFFLCCRERGRLGTGIAFTAATACYLLRTFGITLLGAWVLDAIRQRRFRSAAARAALAMVPVFGWNAYIHSVENSLEYRRPAYAYQRAGYMYYNVSYSTNLKFLNPFRPAEGRATPVNMTVRFFRNLRQLPFSMAEAVTSAYGYWHPQLAWARTWLHRWAPSAIVRVTQSCLAILILLGLLRLLRVDPAMAFYIVLSLLAIASTPWPTQYVRYLAPVAPYLEIALVFGLATVARLMPRNAGGRFTAIAIGLIVIHQAFSLYRCYRVDYTEVTEVTRSGQPVRFRLFYYTETDRAVDAAQQWLMERTRPADIVAASTPHWLYLRTGRKAVMVPFGAEPANMGRLLAEVPVSYIVLDEIGGGSLASFVAPVILNSSEWREVFAPSATCRVFERTPSEPAAGLLR